MIKIKSLNITFQNGRSYFPALKNFNIEIGTEFLAIVGPSGCGKSTFLRTLAGLVKPEKMESIASIFSTNFSYGFVFQDYSLLPWLNVIQNIELGLTMRGMPPEKRKVISENLLNQLGLKDTPGLLPHQLSGGMRQRVAVGRAFAQSAPLLLMDEPFGALDAITREDLQEILVRLYENDPHTIVFVTHDVEEAIFLSDRVCVMSSRPGTVKNLIKIPFSRPRQHSLMRDPDFIKLKHQIEDMLRPVEEIEKRR